LKHSPERLELATLPGCGVGMRDCYVRSRPDALGQRDVALKSTPDGGSVLTQAR